MQDNRLSKYGFKFQSKLIACLMTDAAFVSQVYDLIKLEYFESESIRFIVDVSLDYFKQHKKLPTLEVLKVYVERVQDDLLKQEIVSTLKEAVKAVGATDLDFIKETTLDFCKNEAIKTAIIESIPDIERGNYDAIKRRVDAAMKVGQTADTGLDYFLDIDKRYQEESRMPVSTGWDEIDEIMKGGLAPGELGVAIAPSGAGKSWLLAALGANALRQGKTVIHYTLELSENYTGWRYDCILSGISLDKIKLHVDKVKDELNKIPGRLIIKWFPTKSVSLMGLMSHITKLKMLGTQPDLVIIDYADLLKYDNPKMAKHEILEALYEELRGFAGEIQVPVWTVSQSNREGINTDVIEADKAAGAYAKIFPADFVMSLSRKAQDKLSNTARLHIIKNRFGVDGITFPVFMDTNRGVINVYAEATAKGREVRGTMETDAQYNRQRLKQRFNQLTEKEKTANREQVNNLF